MKSLVLRVFRSFSKQKANIRFSERQRQQFLFRKTQKVRVKQIYPTSSFPFELDSESLTYSEDRQGKKSKCGT
jgi:hypothetical protein